MSTYCTVGSSVADPEPDPYDFGPPGSGSVSTRYGSESGSGSFYHQPKVVSKILIPTVLWLLYDFLFSKNDVNVASKSKKQKNIENFFWLPSWRSLMKIAGSGVGSVCQRYGSEDPDPNQNVTDPQHWLQRWRRGFSDIVILISAEIFVKLTTRLQPPKQTRYCTPA